VNLFESFRASALGRPGNVAVFFGDDEWSYRRLWNSAARLAIELRSRADFRPGRNIAIWMKNCPEFAVALFGILGAECVVVPLNNFLKAAEIGQILDDAEIDLVIRDETMKDLEEHVATGRPQLRFMDARSASEETAEPEFVPVVPLAESDLAVLIYTSGTTGRPKGIMLSNGNFLSNVESCRKMLRVVDHDRFVVLLPMFHSFMFCVSVLLPLLIGGSMVILRSLGHPKAIIAEIIRHKATILPAIPQFFRSLCHPSVAVDLPLRICISGGAPLPAEILKEFTEKFPIPLLEGYGLSETSPAACFNPIQGPWKAGSIGLPIPDVEVSIQDDDGRALGPGETGEVCVRGENVMLGYWRQPEETARVMRGGWLLTGDVGHHDEDGYFYITDRKKDMLLVNGINVYPREIEEVVYRYPGVKEAAVVGFPDSRRGEQPVAFVAAAEGFKLDPDEIIAFIRERLADYKTPRRVEVLPALPRNATGKIQKTALRQTPA
jgi:long-chain acyl-CoA synthetase